MDDDGDYFTWTRSEMQAVVTEAEAGVAGLHYDVNEVGEMHHNPEKNVLYVRAPVSEIAKRMGLTVEKTQALLESARQKMYAARLRRPRLMSTRRCTRDGTRSVSPPTLKGRGY